MWYLYYIVSCNTKFLYIGMTGSRLSTRMAQHRGAAKRGIKTPLYDCMRKHGAESFLIVKVNEYNSKEEAAEAEIAAIKFARENSWKILNLADGGQTGYIITDPVIRARVNKSLALARKGKMPALGMKHTEENKRKFSECGKARWDKYGRYPDDVTQMCFKEAKNRYNISKTHYYRLLKQRANSNEVS